MPRDTRTGQVLENLILPALKQGGYLAHQQIFIGERPGGKAHKIDCIAEKENKKFFISLKWQQSGGTAEQKILYEIICLAKAVKEHKEKGEAVKAYLILGGLDAGQGASGWTLRGFCIEGGFKPYLHPGYAGLTQIMKPEKFIALANKGNL